MEEYRLDSRNLPATWIVRRRRRTDEPLIHFNHTSKIIINQSLLRRLSLSLSRTLLFHAERWRDKEEKKNESNGVDLTSQLKSNINATE